METSELITAAGPPMAAMAAAVVALGAVALAVLWSRVKAYVARTAVTWDDDLVELLEDAVETTLKRRERKMDARVLDKAKD